ncbi:hypothetical protein Fleli_0502 [Bernardetia litoralis DSM 6794]|uniref:Myosin heavy chain n=1 Tax=Bernardetia litoralis (strain ATCC 23117 / DSM 6794 / NBRC 15988 / NCIMB 1366 / Fx l1 / Sio-4) TaxID=880071 RepID=I4AG92_BERLS|nr:hypothetical protein [Bernardetia litoralis]AFM02977.1 hypothetical protein Fleli_0502 [Bernardetia litoralis DSM 6794]
MDKTQIKNDFSSLLKNYYHHRHEVITKEESVAKVKEVTLLQTARTYTPDNIIKGLGTLQLTFADTLTQWSKKLQDESEKRSQIEEAIIIEKKRLENLHQVKLAADALYLLKQEHESKLAELTEAHQKRMELMANSRKEDETFWAKEIHLFEKEVKESEERTKKNRLQEEERFGYDLERNTQLATDAFEGQKKQTHRKLAEQKTEKEKAWSLREEILKEKDEKHQKNLVLIAEFDEKLKNEVKKSREKAANEATKEGKAVAELMEREETANAQIFAEQIEDLKLNVETGKSEVDNLTIQLKNALEQVQSLSLRAFDNSTSK